MKKEINKKKQEKRIPNKEAHQNVLLHLYRDKAVRSHKTLQEQFNYPMLEILLNYSWWDVGQKYSPETTN